MSLTFKNKKKFGLENSQNQQKKIQQARSIRILDKSEKDIFNEGLEKYQNSFMFLMSPMNEIDFFLSSLSFITKNGSG
jgi:hypothetical protein